MNNPDWREKFRPILKICIVVCVADSILFLCGGFLFFAALLAITATIGVVDLAILEYHVKLFPNVEDSTFKAIIRKHWKVRL